MPEVPLDFPRQWIEFVDPADPDQLIRADLTWLTSRWTCIFGSGCQGIYEGRGDDGCCTLGAHFRDKEDRKRVKTWVKLLTDEDWQFRPVGMTDGWLTKDDDGEHKTAVHDGACIFLNRRGSAQGYGCALHSLAAKQGVSFVETKPHVCWQLPIKIDYQNLEREDGSTPMVITVTEYDRRGWGPGGADFHWYCSGNTEAHVGADPVYVSSRDELVALLGQPAYDALVVHCQAREVALAQAAADRVHRRERLAALAAHPADPVPDLPESPAPIPPASSPTGSAGRSGHPEPAAADSGDVATQG